MQDDKVMHNCFPKNHVVVQSTNASATKAEQDSFNGHDTAGKSSSNAGRTTNPPSSGTSHAASQPGLQPAPQQQNAQMMVTLPRHATSELCLLCQNQGISNLPAGTP